MGLHQSSPATLLFRISKVRLLLAGLCCCQSPGGGLEPWPAQGLSHWNGRRKCGRISIIITAKVDEALSSSQVSFQTLDNILHLVVS